MAQIWTTREAVSAAFWAQISSAVGFTQTSRKFRHWDQVTGSGMMPFLTMLKTAEDRIWQTDGTPIIKFFYHVFVYTMTGDLTAIPETVMNTLMDALDAVSVPQPSDPGYMQGRNTLGGLVYYCRPNGHVFVDAGEVDGKGVAAVAYEILLPWWSV